MNTWSYMQRMNSTSNVPGANRFNDGGYPYWGYSHLRDRSSDKRRERLIMADIFFFVTLNDFNFISFRWDLTCTQLLRYEILRNQSRPSRSDRLRTIVSYHHKVSLSTPWSLHGPTATIEMKISSSICLSAEVSFFHQRTQKEKHHLDNASKCINVQVLPPPVLPFIIVAMSWDCRAFHSFLDLSHFLWMFRRCRQ